MHQPLTRDQPALTGKANLVGAGPSHLPVGLMAGMLVLMTIAAYWPATRCDFVNLDDPIHVTSVVQVQRGLSPEGIKWAFLNPVANNWHPLTVLSHMLDCQLFGLRPWGHHLVNVLLHALNAGLVFLLLQRMTGAKWRSLLVASLFSLHPLRVESVAWVTERKDVLSSFFGLLALIAYARYAQAKASNQCSVISNQSSGGRAADHGPRARDHRSLITDHRLLFYLLSLFFFALGLMSKPMLVTWPFVMLLLDYWPLRRLDLSTLNSQLSTTLRLVREKAPFFLLAVLMSVITFTVQKRGGALAAGDNFSVSVRLGNALISYGRYLGKTFWPTELAVVYPHPGAWALGKVLLASGLLLGISVLVWTQRRRYSFLLMGWLWYCGTLVPVSQVIQTGSHAMADRWTYVPSLGVLILAVWGACEVGRRWRYQVLGLSVFGGAAVLICLTLTRHQIGYWKDSETLLRHAIAVTENNDLAHKNLGTALYQKGQVDEAVQHFQEFVRLTPKDADAHYNLGVALDKQGRVNEAIAQFQEALLLKPRYADVHYNLGVAFYQLGRTNEAVREFQETIRLNPDHAQAHNNLGTALGMQGRTDEAIHHFREALRLWPDYADARKNLDIVLASRAPSSAPPGTVTNR